MGLWYQTGGLSWEEYLFSKDKNHTQNLKPRVIKVEFSENSPSLIKHVPTTSIKLFYSPLCIDFTFEKKDLTLAIYILFFFFFDFRYFDREKYASCPKGGLYIPTKPQVLTTNVIDKVYSTIDASIDSDDEGEFWINFSDSPIGELAYTNSQKIYFKIINDN